MKHFENEEQQTETLEEVRQPLLAELDASKEIEALSDEELEVISGGGLSNMLAKAKTVYQNRFQLHPGNIIPAIKNKMQTAMEQSSSNHGININGRWP